MKRMSTGNVTSIVTTLTQIILISTHSENIKCVHSGPETSIHDQLNHHLNSKHWFLIACYSFQKSDCDVFSLFPLITLTFAQTTRVSRVTLQRRWKHHRLPLCTSRLLDCSLPGSSAEASKQRSVGEDEQRMQSVDVPAPWSMWSFGCWKLNGHICQGFPPPHLPELSADSTTEALFARVSCI